MEETKIRYKDLSKPLRFAAIGGYTYLVLTAAGFVIGFIIGFAGAL